MYVINLSWPISAFVTNEYITLAVHEFVVRVGILHRGPCIVIVTPNRSCTLFSVLL